MALPHSMTRTILRAATITVAAVSFATPLAAQQNNDIRAVLQRMERIERDIETLSGAVYKGQDMPAPRASGNSNPSLIADMQVRLNEVENSLRRLTGQIETQNHHIQQLQNHMETLMGDIEVRFQQMEAGSATGAYPTPTQLQPAQPELPAASLNPDEMTASPAQTTETESVTTPPLPVTKNELAAGTATKMYNDAFQHIRAGNYPKAEEAFKVFLEKYPQDDLTPNAEYWLAETYYVRGQYAQAAQAFAKGYQSHPKSNKAPDNLLKLALSLSGMGRTDDACLALVQLREDFPNAGQSITDRVDQEEKRLGCP